jgi:hypothetical protein
MTSSNKKVEKENLMTSSNKVNFTPEEVKAYLTECVKVWRAHKKKVEIPKEFEAAFEALSEEEQFAVMAIFYVDAFQSVHCSLFNKQALKDKIPRYWSFTIKYTPRNPLPVNPFEAEACEQGLKCREGDEYEAHCLSEEYGTPEETVDYSNKFHHYMPIEALVDKRLISKEEYEAWIVDQNQICKDNAITFQKMRDKT